MEKVCPQCGHVNRAAGIFCAKCGMRLTAPPREDSRRRSFHPFSFLWGLFKLAIAIGAIALLVGLFWAPPVPAPVTDAALAEAFDASMERLLEAIEQRRPHTEVIPADRINAYLSRQLAAGGAGGDATGMTVGLRQVRVDIENERVRVTVDASYGPVRIVMAAAGRPTVTEKGFAFRVEETRVGRIAAPLRYGGWIAAKIETVFAGLQRERHVLDAARSIEFKEGLIRLTAGSGRAPGG